MKIRKFTEKQVSKNFKNPIKGGLLSDGISISDHRILIPVKDYPISTASKWPGNKPMLDLVYPADAVLMKYTYIGQTEKDNYIFESENKQKVYILNTLIRLLSTFSGVTNTDDITILKADFIHTCIFLGGKYTLPDKVLIMPMTSQY